ncbi:integral membrane protein [Colletotrichum karsti]|uniref:Integral membrane protein n=1 Tax=Colletotrichum karsti TaxID=1095194 RepID=A0A9P6I504_9PEZI|nr:uncharacterized protein CkaCkLH20_10432 [Colletotrichum karsti]KAF9872095.1 integral membrane protein [Colletotrichum karsti]
MADAADLEPITTVIVPIAPTADALQVIYTNIVLVVLVSIWTGLRLYSRHMRRVPFGVDDHLYMVSLIAAWVTMGLATSWMLMTILIGLLICRPIAMQWDPTIPGGVCGDQVTAFAAVGVVDLIVDVIIFVLPIPMVLKLQVSRAHRIALISIFGAGVLTIVFGALRLASVFAVDFLDFSYTSPTAMIWASAEVGVALMVSSSPILRPVFDRVFGRFISTLRSSAGRTDPNISYYAGGKSGATGPHTLISAAKHPSRFPGGFMAMSDSDENLEMETMGRKGSLQAAKISSGRQRLDHVHGELEGGHVHRDDASTDKIFVRTEIVQQTT